MKHQWSGIDESTYDLICSAIGNYTYEQLASEYEKYSDWQIEASLSVEQGRVVSAAKAAFKDAMTEMQIDGIHQ